jgi:hypothetical protein
MIVVGVGRTRQRRIYAKKKKAQLAKISTTNNYQISDVPAA